MRDICLSKHALTVSERQSAKKGENQAPVLAETKEEDEGGGFELPRCCHVTLGGD